MSRHDAAAVARAKRALDEEVARRRRGCRQAIQRTALWAERMQKASARAVKWRAHCEERMLVAIGDREEAEAWLEEHVGEAWRELPGEDEARAILAEGWK